MTADVIAVGDVRINLGQQSFAFTPADDMTGKESALVLQMFMNALAYRGDGVIDFGSYITKHNLQKHFTEIKDEPKESQEATQGVGVPPSTDEGV